MISSLNSDVGGNFSSHALIAARPLTDGSLGGSTTASLAYRPATPAKSLARTPFTKAVVESRIAAVSAAVSPACARQTGAARKLKHAAQAAAPRVFIVNLRWK